MRILTWFFCLAREKSFTASSFDSDVTPCLEMVFYINWGGCIDKSLLGLTEMKMK